MAATKTARENLNAVDALAGEVWSSFLFAPRSMQKEYQKAYEALCLARRALRTLAED